MRACLGGDREDRGRESSRDNDVRVGTSRPRTLNGFPVSRRRGGSWVVTKGDLLRVACAALDGPEVSQQPVSRFMAHGVLALRPMDSLRSAVQYMVESKLRSLPVIDAECRVLGMVSRNDLMAAIAPEAV